MAEKPPANRQEANKKEFDFELDRFEKQLAELRVMYEQYFIDVLPLPPDKPHAAIKRQLKALLRAPFKDSAKKFRLRTLITRYQTYATYWERVMKQREEGTYTRDVFKADSRERMAEEDRKALSQAGIAEKGIKQLYTSYESALKKAGIQANNIDYNAFKKNLLQKAKQLKQKHGASKISYKIVVKNGKAVIKASTKK